MVWKHNYEKDRNRRLKKKFGIDLQEYWILFENQDGCCALCNKHADELKEIYPRYKYSPLHVDHDHTTGKIRGLLCVGCNTSLGRLGDNEESILKVLEYLKGRQLMQNFEVLLRRPVSNDADELITLVKEHCEENDLEYDEESIKMYLYLQMTQLPSIVAVLDNKVVGAISFAILPDHFKSNKFYAEKLAVFVSKDQRKKGIGTALLDRAEEVCRQQGVKEFYFKGSYGPKGYSEIEKQYKKELG